MKGASRIFGLLAVPVVVLAMLWLAEVRPGYFANVTYLGGILLLEIVAAAVWHYERAFFTVLMLTFLWAGTAIPLSAAAGIARWVVLSAGALVGLVRWTKGEGRQPYGAIHLAAFLCVLSAAVSSMVSTRPSTSLLKVTSVFLLFLYCSFGARLAAAGREAFFFHGLLTACEITSYLTAIVYVGLRFEIFGNPNSLGAVMGVVIVPLLFWGVLVAETRNVRQRRLVALCLSAWLLFSSVARAGIVAGAFSVTLMCLALHRGRLLMKGVFALIFLMATIAVVQPERFDSLTSSFSDNVIYKGKPELGILESRKSPWEDSVAVIRESPWFGSGFGTDFIEGGATDAVFRTTSDSAKEHGNSYLALAQHVGLLGIIPFVVLLCMILRLIGRVCLWMWRSRSPGHYAIPLAFICVAGLIHAFFEDWLLAVGYYLSIFFWASVFILSDVQAPPPRDSVPLSNAWRAPVGAGTVPLSTAQ
jgi:O-antigen ligase